MFNLAACVVVAFLASGTVFSAPSPYVRPSNGDCVTSFSTSQDYFPQQYQLVGTTVPATSGSVKVSVATGFTVDYYPSYKVVNNTVANDLYVLYQCGTTAPAASLFPAGTKIFQVPLTKVAVAESVPYGFLAALGVADRAQSVSSFTVAPCAQKQVACGQTVSSSTLSNATLLAQNVLPNVDGIVTSSKKPSSPFFTFSASLDPGTLNRAEWIKFMGLFFNLEKEASTYFQTVQAAYNAKKASATGTKTTPVAAFTQHFTYLADESLQISFAAYKNQYALDAGASILNRTQILAAYPNVTKAGATDLAFSWNPTTGGFSTKEAAIAAFHSVMKQVDVVIDETYEENPTLSNLTTFLDSYFITPATQAQFPFLVNGAVFREDGLISAAPAYGLDWFEGAIVRPDAVLTDFIRAIHPTLLPASYNATWIRNIATGEVPVIVGADSCTALQSCSSPATTICPYVQTCPNGTSLMRSLNGSACIACEA